MGAMTIERALLVRRSCRSFDGRAIELDLLCRLLWAAQGISDDTGKRIAPSAHALHPLNLVLVAGFDDESTTKVLKLRPPIEPVLYLYIGWPGDG